MNYQGYIIYRERLRRNWSQAGLCKGICTVSYLSKIESGKSEPSEEIVRLLLDRLDLEIDQEIEREAAKLADHVLWRPRKGPEAFLNGSGEPYSFRLWSVRVAIPAALSICSADSRSLTRKTT